MKSSSLFILGLVTCSLLWSFHSSGSIFDEDEQQNTIDQLSLNQVSEELNNLEQEEKLAQVYLPAQSETQSEVVSDEVGLKEAATLHDSGTKPVLRERSR